MFNLTADSESCCVETHYKEFTAVFHNFPATHTCSLLIVEEDYSTFFRVSIQFIITPLHCSFCSNSAYSEVCCVNTHYKEFRAVVYNFVATHTCKLLIAEDYCPTLLIVSIQLIITPLHCHFCSISAYSEVCCVETHCKEFAAVVHNFSDC